MDTALILGFLDDLRRNNSTVWMKENKPRYNEAKREFELLLQELIDRISLFDLSVANLIPKEIIYRLNRDIRFSKDKSPYTPAFSANISAGKKLWIPAGYFVHIMPEQIFLGGGIYTTALTKATKLIRDHIAENPEEFLGIINNPDFHATYDTVHGEKLKNTPREYPRDHPAAEYLKHKSWDILCKIEDSEFLKPGAFVDLAVEKFRVMKPFNDFINEALVDFSF